MNACESCPFGPAFGDTVQSLDSFSRELTDRSEKVWELALQTQAAAQEFDGLSDSPGARAQVDQKQSHILDTTARLTRISHDVRSLLDTTFERAEATNCPTNDAGSAIRCFKMDMVLAMQPELDSILKDLPKKS